MRWRRGGVGRGRATASRDRASAAAAAVADFEAKWVSGAAQDALRAENVAFKDVR